MKASANLKFVSLTLAVAAAFTVLTAQPVSADTMSLDGALTYTLTLYENFSSGPGSLTYIYSNASNPTPFTVTPQAKDLWDVTANSSITLDPFFEYFFAEGAGDPAGLNNVVKGSATLPSFTVHSDLDPGSGVPVISGRIGTEGAAVINVQFVDLASAAETAAPGVPDGGSSLMLLAVSLAALIGLTKLRRLCVA